MSGKENTFCYIQFAYHSPLSTNAKAQNLNKQLKLSTFK